jgi:hypothetical protein
MWLEARSACPCGLMVHVLELLLLHATSERPCFVIMGRFHKMIKIGVVFRRDCAISNRTRRQLSMEIAPGSAVPRQH